jgi:hypothetical protein
MPTEQHFVKLESVLFPAFGAPTIPTSVTSFGSGSDHLFMHAIISYEHISK